MQTQLTTRSITKAKRQTRGTRANRFDLPEKRNETKSTDSIISLYPGKPNKKNMYLYIPKIKGNEIVNGEEE